MQRYISQHCRGTIFRVIDLSCLWWFGAHAKMTDSESSIPWGLMLKMEKKSIWVINVWAIEYENEEINDEGKEYSISTRFIAWHDMHSLLRHYIRVFEKFNSSLARRNIYLYRNNLWKLIIIKMTISNSKEDLRRYRRYELSMCSNFSLSIFLFEMHNTCLPMWISQNIAQCRRNSNVSNLLGHWCTLM